MKNNNIVLEFKDTWSNSRKWLKKEYLSIYDKMPTGSGAEGVSCCVYSAYLDACRTFKLKKETHDSRNTALINLQDRIIKYLESDDPKNFQHQKWSDELIKDFTDCCINMNCGKAQKIINMSFKYFYCCNDKPKDKMFYPCHMALDQFTLSWYKNISKVYFDGWSNITNYDLYKNIQKHIRKYLSKQKKYSKYPIIAEFDIWRKERTAYEVFELTNRTTEKEYDEKTKLIRGMISKL